jgi:plasmid replication initiation protein
MAIHDIDHALEDSVTRAALEPQRNEQLVEAKPIARQPTKDDAILYFRDDAVEVRSDLTQREYKFVFYLLAMIDPKDPVMQRTFKLDVGRFAELSGLDARPLWTELKALTQNLTKKQLRVYGAIFPNGEYRPGGYRGIVNWLSSVGYFDEERFLIVNLTPEVVDLWNKSFFKKLGPNQCFSMSCDHFFRLRSIYSGRLYTFLSGRRNEKIIKVDLVRLREILLQPALPDPDQAAAPLPLSLYKDFKKRAIDSAITEINKRSDLEVKYVESRCKGSKTVVQLIFNVQQKLTSQMPQKQEHDALKPSLPSPEQPKLGQQRLCFTLPPTLPGSDSPEIKETLARIRAQWGLTPSQTQDLEAALLERGIEYVLSWERHAQNNGKNPIGLFCDAMKTRRPLKVAPLETIQRGDVDWDWKDFLAQSGMSPPLIPETLSAMSDRMFKHYILPEHRKRVRGRTGHALAVVA